MLVFGVDPHDSGEERLGSLQNTMGTSRDFWGRGNKITKRRHHKQDSSLTALTLAECRPVDPGEQGRGHSH